MNKIMRQGDVLLVRVERAPKNAKPVERDGGRVVLAYGEVTGHAHAISEDWVELLEAEANERYLWVRGKAATLRHEEHAAITLDPGTYRIVRQREYAPGEIRNVAD